MEPDRNDPHRITIRYMNDPEERQRRLVQRAVRNAQIEAAAHTEQIRVIVHLREQQIPEEPEMPELDSDDEEDETPEQTIARQKERIRLLLQRHGNASPEDIEKMVDRTDTITQAETRTFRRQLNELADREAIYHVDRIRDELMRKAPEGAFDFTLINKKPEVETVEALAERLRQRRRQAMQSRPPATEHTEQNSSDSENDQNQPGTSAATAKKHKRPHQFMFVENRKPPESSKPET